MTVKYFITGATGFIGRNLCKKLIEEGHEVSALVRGHNLYLESIGVNQVIGDLLYDETYKNELEGINTIIHLGGNPCFANGEEYYTDNTEATKLLINAFEQIDIKEKKRFVYVSSLGAVDRHNNDNCDIKIDETYAPSPTTDYGKSKLLAENIVCNSTISWVIIRPTLVIGKEMRLKSHISVFIDSSLNKKLFSRFNWPGKVSFIHVDDLVNVLILASIDDKAVHKTFFAASNNIKIGKILEMVNPKERRIPLGLISSIIKKLMTPLIPYKLKCLLFDAMSVSNKRLKELDWKPKKDVNESINEIIDLQKTRKDFARPINGYALITGAASGLGKALAEELYNKYNRKLILIDKNEDALSNILSNTDNVIKFTCDLSKDDDVANLLALPLWANEGIDEIYACAGLGIRKEASKITNNVQSDIIKINLESNIRICQNATNFMLNKQFGRIILISSSAAFQPLPYMSAYAASKSGLLSYGEALWGELNNSGIEVLNICPGGVKTNFQQSAGVKVLPRETLDSPQIVAKEILKLIGKNRCTAAIGMRAQIMDIISRIMPRKIRVLFWKKLMDSMR